MPTERQALGARGERAVHDHVSCLRCGRDRHLSRLPTNFQCADVICKFCGFLAQIKTVTLDGDELPDHLMGAAWGPQQEQMIAGIFHGLYVVGFSRQSKLVRMDYVPGHILQASPDVFQPRNPLGPTARRAGWQGFMYDLSKIPKIGIQRVYPR